MESEKKDSALVRSSAAEYLTFVASTGEDKDSIEMRYEDENIWLTQKMMATLYDVGLPTINEHIKKIYADHEQDEAATIRKFRIVAASSNSLSAYIFLICSFIVGEPTSYNVAIIFCVSHIFSSS